MNDDFNNETANETPSIENKPSAVILPFRPRRVMETNPAINTPVVPSVSSPVKNARDEAQERLVAALATLNAAIAQQKEAIAAWRESIGKLKTVTDGLGASARRLHDNIGTIAEGTEKIRETSLNTVEILNKAGY